MARLLDNWFLTARQELLYMATFGIAETLLECFWYVPQLKMQEVWGPRVSRGSPCEGHLIKTILPMVVVIINKSSLAYLATQILMTACVVMDMFPVLILPWLVVAGLRNLVVDSVAMGAGVFLCCSEGYGNLCRCYDATVASVLETVIQLYMWSSVRILYKQRRRGDATEPPPEALMTAIASEEGDVIECYLPDDDAVDVAEAVEEAEGGGEEEAPVEEAEAEAAETNIVEEASDVTVPAEPAEEPAADQEQVEEESVVEEEEQQQEPEATGEQAVVEDKESQQTAEPEVDVEETVTAEEPEEAEEPSGEQQETLEDMEIDLPGETAPDAGPEEETGEQAAAEDEQVEESGEPVVAEEEEAAAAGGEAETPEEGPEAEEASEEEAPAEEETGEEASAEDVVAPEQGPEGVEAEEPEAETVEEAPAAEEVAAEDEATPEEPPLIQECFFDPDMLSEGEAAELEQAEDAVAEVEAAPEQGPEGEEAEEPPVSDEKSAETVDYGEPVEVEIVQEASESAGPEVEGMDWAASVGTQGTASVGGAPEGAEEVLAVDEADQPPEEAPEDEQPSAEAAPEEAPEEPEATGEEAVADEEAATPEEAPEEPGEEAVADEEAAPEEEPGEEAVVTEEAAPEEAPEEPGEETVAAEEAAPEEAPEEPGEEAVADEEAAPEEAPEEPGEEAVADEEAAPEEAPEEPAEEAVAAEEAAPEEAPEEPGEEAVAAEEAAPEEEEVMDEVEASGLSCSAESADQPMIVSFGVSNEFTPEDEADNVGERPFETSISTKVLVGSFSQIGSQFKIKPYGSESPVPADNRLGITPRPEPAVSAQVNALRQWNESVLASAKVRKVGDIKALMDTIDIVKRQGVDVPVPPEDAPAISSATMAVHIAMLSRLSSKP